MKKIAFYSLAEFLGKVLITFFDLIAIVVSEILNILCLFIALIFSLLWKALFYIKRGVLWVTNLFVGAYESTSRFSDRKTNRLWTKRNK